MLRPRYASPQVEGGDGPANEACINVLAMSHEGHWRNSAVSRIFCWNKKRTTRIAKIARPRRMNPTACFALLVVDGSELHVWSLTTYQMSQICAILAGARSVVTPAEQVLPP